MNALGTYLRYIGNISSVPQIGNEVTHLPTYTYTHTRTHTRAHTHTHTHTRTHTHTHLLKINAIDIVM